MFIEHLLYARICSEVLAYLNSFDLTTALWGPYFMAPFLKMMKLTDIENKFMITKKEGEKEG